jgi:ribosome-associated heat shock protein Hsp15
MIALPPGESVRIDQWLSAARIFRSRTEATEACTDGLVRLNGTAVKPSHLVRPGDEVTARAPRGNVLLMFLRLADKRLSPTRARELYEDHSPAPPPREVNPLPRRAPGTGRPTKRQRREMDRLRGV